MDMLRRYTNQHLFDVIEGKANIAKVDLLVFKLTHSDLSEEIETQYAISRLLKKPDPDVEKYFIELVESEDLSLRKKYHLIRAMPKFNSLEALNVLVRQIGKYDYDINSCILYSLLDFYDHSEFRNENLQPVLDGIYMVISKTELDGLDYLMAAEKLDNDTHPKVSKIFSNFPTFSGEELGFGKLKKIFLKRGVRL